MTKIFIGTGRQELYFEPSSAIFHGVIAGADGGGKTTTARILAEGFSKAGIPISFFDTDGDFESISQPGAIDKRLVGRAASLNMENYEGEYFPTLLWDPLAQHGSGWSIPVSELGPILLSKYLGLSRIKMETLLEVFSLLDSERLVIDNLNELLEVLSFIEGQNELFNKSNSKLSANRITEIIKAITVLPENILEVLSNLRALSREDLLTVGDSGFGRINVFSVNKSVFPKQMIAAFQLWLLSTLSEGLAAPRGVEQPVAVVFIERADLIFKSSNDENNAKILNLLRMLALQGIGVFFLVENICDIPEIILAELKNRWQHRIGGKDLRGEANLFSGIKSEESIDIRITRNELGEGEALVSLFSPREGCSSVEWVLIPPPQSRLGPLTDGERQILVDSSLVLSKDERTGEELEGRFLQFRRIALKESLKGIVEIDGSDKVSPLGKFVFKKGRTIGRLAGVALRRGIFGTLLRS